MISKILIMGLLAMGAAGPAWGARPSCSGRMTDSHAAVPTMRETETERWLNAHEAIRRRVERSPGADLVLVGDSLLAHSTKGGLPAYLADKAILNLAIGGDQTQNVLWRLEHLPLDRASPRQVVVLVGTNNLRRNDPACAIVEGIGKVVHTVRSAWPDAQIVLLGLLPRGPGLAFRQASRLEVNEALKELGEREKFTYTDPSTTLWCGGSNDCGYYVEDLVHLTHSGYEKLWSVLRPTLEGPPPKADNSR